MLNKQKRKKSRKGDNNMILLITHDYYTARVHCRMEIVHFLRLPTISLKHDKYINFQIVFSFRYCVNVMSTIH